MKKTGWPPGMLQDDDNRLSRWLANRPGARYQVRKNMTEQQPLALRLADELDGASNGPMDFKHKAAAELRRLHSVNAQLLEALQQIIDLPEDSRIHYKVARRAIAATKEKS